MSGLRLLLPAFLAGCFCCTPLQALPAKAGDKDVVPAAPVTQFIVKLRQADTAMPIAVMTESRVAGLGKLAGKTLHWHRNMSSGASVLRLAAAVSATEADAIARRLELSPDVEHASPDYRRRIFMLPNDTRFSEQWSLMDPASTIGGISTTGGASLPGAWDRSLGSSNTVIAVVDTGILMHAELGARVLPGYDFISDTVTSNDGDGRDNNALDAGDWITASDATDHPVECSGQAASDSSWHGTHVAGIAAATGNNGTGMAGISWGASILPVRALGKCGGFDSDIIDGVRWAAGLSVPGIPVNPHPAIVINLSLGSSSRCTAAWQSALNDVYAMGVTVVAATGNDFARTVSSPANCNHVIAVTANSVEGLSSIYANTGTQTTISAPGGGLGTDSGGNATGSGLEILSLGNTGTTVPGSDTYVFMMGTSQATPHVTGTIALLHELLPTASPDRLRQLLTGSARAFPSGSWCTHQAQLGKCGAGLLDAGAALQAAAIVATSNHVPVPDVLPTQSGIAGQAMHFTVTATDADGDALSFDTVSRPAGSTLSGTGAFTWNSPVIGHATLSYTVSDGISSSALQTVDIVITSPPPPPPPPPAPGSSGGGAASGELLLLLAITGLRTRRRR
ncbi:MAG: S8 family serine peptidase [bacterium]|nr:S8 family serine peptidase [bacterium]